MTTNPATRPFWVFAGSGIDVKEGVVVVECCFASYDEFLTEYQTYRFDECSNCNGCCELVETDLTCTIEGRILHFSPILVLRCKRCGNEFLPKHTKQMIDGTYRTAVKENQTIGEFYPTGYKKKFEYCTEQNYEYDHRDYYNIPGLCYDEEHSVEGFLTPVYFEKEALVFFLAMPEYEVEILSESYGYIAKKDSSGLYQYDWNIPFGFNTNGKLIMWLGDIDGMDDKTKAISSIRSRSSNSARNTTQQVDSSAANTSIVEKVADIVEKTNRSLPCENDVSGHKQRYHTKNGVIWKNKAPYHRGGNNG